MDISKYRDNTELSDICVTVENQDFNLHKFPLSINSEYFKTECKTLNKIRLENFPGGKENFEIIADHCYGKDVELTTENVLSIFVSSHYLEMKGKNNLIEKCQKFIERIYRSAEYSHSIDDIEKILQSCKLIKSDVLNSFVDRGFEIIIQIWLRPLTGYNTNLKEKYIENSIFFEKILNFDSYMIEKIIDHCSSDESKYPFLSRLIVSFLELQFLRDNDEKYEEKKQDQYTLQNKVSDRYLSSSSLSSSEESNKNGNIYDSEMITATENDDSNTNEHIREAFDNVINSLPNEISLGKLVNVEWLQNALTYCDKYECKTKNKLLQICGGMLSHSSIEELKSMDPQNIKDLIKETLNNDKVDRGLMKWIWDHHILEMAESNELDPALFNKIIENMPDSQNIDPDIVFRTVISMLKNGGEKYKDQLIGSVNLEKVSPENLEIAVESKIWNVEVICKVAIKRLKDTVVYKNEKRNSFQETKKNYDSRFNDVGDHGNKYRSPSNFKSHSYTNHLNSFPTDYEKDFYESSPKCFHNYYWTSKYDYCTHSPDSYLTLKENLRYELKKISDSYTDYYRRRLSSRTRTKYPIAYNYHF